MADKNETVRARIKGRALPLPGDDVDTDRIIPARFLKTISFEGLGRSVFYDERFDERGGKKQHPFNDPRFGGARILIVGRNFGCGSSREHAPQAIARWGIEAVIGESFSEIFSGNSTAIGMPAVRVGRGDAEWLVETVNRSPETEVEIDLRAKTVLAGGREMQCEIPEGDRTLLVGGEWDTTAVLLKNLEAIHGTARKIPYIQGFGAL
jgi:3-isopropylmalate/(R)-2-methylmalate dehydratase small subunit